jgi:hypothetical protein
MTMVNIRTPYVHLVTALCEDRGGPDAPVTRFGQPFF